jgi:hypothetical protein
MTDIKPKKPRTNKYPAEGVTLEMKLNDLVEVYGGKGFAKILELAA